MDLPEENARLVEAIDHTRVVGVVSAADIVRIALLQERDVGIHLLVGGRCGSHRPLSVVIPTDQLRDLAL